MKNLQLLTLFDSNSSPLIELELPWVKNSGCKLYLKRDNLRYIPAYDGDVALGGNKLRKLKYAILQNNGRGILSFGGLHSNHIAALASAGSIFGFPTIGIIRGELLVEKSPTLQHALKCGMELISLRRTDYKNKDIQDYGLEMIPEGGTNENAIMGVSEMVKETNFEDECIWITPVGTGGTLKGIKKTAKVIGISVLKGYSENIEGATIINNYHFGGYAKWNSELVLFLHDFFDHTGIPLDPLYTGKMLFGIKDLLIRGFFKEGTNLIAVHTGGLQGIQGFNFRFNQCLPNLNNIKNVSLK